MGWHLLQIFGVLLSTIFFFIGYWAGLRNRKLSQWQSEVLEEQRTLQVAVMELELEEKLGAIGRGLIRLEEDDMACSPTVLHDSLAGLAVYGLAEERLEESETIRGEFRTELEAALEKLLKVDLDRGKVLAAKLLKKINRFGAAEVTLTLAIELRSVLETAERNLRGTPEGLHLRSVLDDVKLIKRPAAIARPLADVRK